MSLKGRNKGFDFEEKEKKGFPLRRWGIWGQKLEHIAMAVDDKKWEEWEWE